MKKSLNLADFKLSKIPTEEEMKKKSMGK